MDVEYESTVDPFMRGWYPMTMNWLLMLQLNMNRTEHSIWDVSLPFMRRWFLVIMNMDGLLLLKVIE